MKNFHLDRMRVAIALTACFSLAAPAVLPQQARSADASGSRVAMEMLNSTFMSWQPLVEYSSMTLTVSGPDGLIITHEFTGGTLPAIDFRFENNMPFPDGSYNYELRLAPVLEPRTKRELAEARKRGGISPVRQLRASGALPAEPLIYTGHFRISGGVAALPAVE